MKIHITSTSTRRKPQIGDRRHTKKHGHQIRVVEIHDGMWVTSGGRYRYEWKSPADLLGTQWDYLLTANERAAVLLMRDVEASIFFGGTQKATSAFQGLSECAPAP